MRSWGRIRRGGENETGTAGCGKVQHSWVWFHRYVVLFMISKVFRIHGSGIVLIPPPNVTFASRNVTFAVTRILNPWVFI